MNTMTISCYPAVIAFDPDMQMFRGEFVGLNGGADFYAADVEGLKHEGEISLRVGPAIHEAAAIAAAAHGQSLTVGYRSHPAGGIGALTAGYL